MRRTTHRLSWPRNKNSEPCGTRYQTSIIKAGVEHPVQNQFRKV